MADNYLENQYAEYEARKAAWQKAQKQQTRPSQSNPQTPKSVTSQIAQNPRRIFITGGAEGIGRTIVKAFAAAGHRVAFCDKNETVGAKTAQATGSLFFAVDVSNADALEQCIQNLFRSWGDIDVIINNVGIGGFSPLVETSIEDFDHILSVNLRPVFITARALAVHRKNDCTVNNYGRIINISSTRHLMSEAGCEGYAASKGGITSLTHALALSLAKKHITVNSISPGWIEVGNYEALAAEDHAQHPSGRVGCPEDIARMCLFLIETGNDFINGQDLVIDGGMSKKMSYRD